MTEKSDREIKFLDTAVTGVIVDQHRDRQVVSKLSDDQETLKSSLDHMGLVVQGTNERTSRIEEILALQQKTIDLLQAKNNGSLSAETQAVKDLKGKK